MSDEFERVPGAEESVAKTESPGARLREVRESHDLALGQVALSLHVDETLLRSLEEDDYTKLGAPIFVKGHLRNYAKLLELDAAELIRLYEQYHQPVDPALKNRVPDGPRMQHHGSGAWLRWFGAILLLVLLVVLAGWWYYRQEAVPAGVVSEFERPVDVLADRQPQPGTGGEETGNEAGSEMPPEDTGKDAGAGVPVAEGDEEVVTPSTPASTGNTDTTRDPERQLDSAASTTVAGETGSLASGSASGSETAQDSQQPAAAGQRRIVLEFTGESWVEIYDSQDQPLLYDLKVAGSRHELDVAGPVRLFLGNAPEVRITVDGESFDVARFIRRDNTARFRIPPEA